MQQHEILAPLRFTTEDRVELIGWLARPADQTDVAVVHVHGMSGNGFENVLIDRLREANMAASRAFFAFNNRGAGVINWTLRSDGSKLLGGACYEKFEESAFDIRAAIDAIEAAGYSRVILQGHSLACAKVVQYLANNADSRIEAVVLLAPTDMQRWSTRDETMRADARLALEMVADGRGNQLVGEACFDGAPLSARVYAGYAELGGPPDIYGTKVGRLIRVPVLVVYGTEDIGIVDMYGDTDTWHQQASEAFPADARFAIIDGAGHGFKERLDELADVVNEFLSRTAPAGVT